MNKIKINNYYSTTPLPPLYYALCTPNHTTVINNNNFINTNNVTYSKVKSEGKVNDEVKKENEKNDTLEKAFVVGTGVALAFASTYVLAKGEYITYWLSDIDF